MRTTGFYWASRGLVRLLALAFLRLRVQGLERFPRQGGVLVVANHLSIADPPLLAAISPRPLAFMGKWELFRLPVFAAVLRGWRVFPVRRGQVDVAAVRQALQLLRDGEAVVVFPEGTRRPHGLGEPLPGIGYFAARSGCPVVPVSIQGTETIRLPASFVTRSEVTFRIGEPFQVASDDVEAAADRIMVSIAELLPPERRGRFAVAGRGGT